MSDPKEKRTGQRSFKPPRSLTTPIAETNSHQFRESLDNLLTMAEQVQELRASLAQSLGVSEPQYRLVWAIAELQAAEGATVTMVARRLRVTGAFVTTEVAKLCKLGLVSKRSNPVDGRSVLLRLEPKGERALETVGARAQQINNSYFRSISSEEFEGLSRVVAKLIVNGADALSLIDASKSLPRGPIGLLGRSNPASRPGRRVEQRSSEGRARKSSQSAGKERKHV